MVMTSFETPPVRRVMFALWTIVLISVFAPFASIAQKAYDIEKFRGSSENFEVTFNFAVGYGSASDASVLDKTTGKQIPFRYDFDAPFGKVQLVSENENELGRLVIHVDPNDLSNHKSLKCTAQFGKKEWGLTLKRVAQ